MSAVWETSLQCDANCGREYGHYAEEGSHWPSKPATAAQLRREARENGWVRRKGLDLCPDCRLLTYKEIMANLRALGYA